MIGKEIDDKYMAELKKQIIHPDVIQEMADDIKIVYTPLCGTGNKPVRRILSELGFKHVYVVPEQENPDPNFTTLDYPNPEDPQGIYIRTASGQGEGCGHRSGNRSRCRPSGCVCQGYQDRRVCGIYR